MENKFEFLGEELYKYRKEKGLSQEELANKINVSRQSIHLWEAGKSIPDLENIANLCSVLEITTDKITNGLDIIKVKKVNLKKYLHIIIKILIFLCVIYICSSLRKSYILMKLNNKYENYRNLDNYSYIEQYNEGNKKSLKTNNFYQNTVYYKNNIYKSSFININIKTTIFEDNNKKERYIIDEKNKTYEENLNFNKYTPENVVIPVGVSTRVSLGENLQIVNFLYGFNPNLKIKSNKNAYIFYYSTKALDKKINIEEVIDKETGLVKQIVKYKDDDKFDIFTYEININMTTDEDIKKPELNEYTKIIK